MSFPIAFSLLKISGFVLLSSSSSDKFCQSSICYSVFIAFFWSFFWNSLIAFFWNSFLSSLLIFVGTCHIMTNKQDCSSLAYRGTILETCTKTAGCHDSASLYSPIPAGTAYSHAQTLSQYYCSYLRFIFILILYCTCILLVLRLYSTCIALVLYCACILTPYGNDY